METIKVLWNKYKEIINYLIFGVLTTLVNYVSYLILAKACNVDYMVSTVIAQIISILFAYVTNKLFVFQTKGLSKKEFFKEMFSFFGFRILSLFLDMGFMYLFVDVLHLNDVIMKLVSNVLIVIANYIFSKVFIFKNKQHSMTNKALSIIPLLNNGIFNS